jgi:hypothetical protein
LHKITQKSGKLACAVRDLRYLLNQGYPRDSATNFVANHYRLALGERHLLARCVFSRTEVAKHRVKAIGAREVEGRRLGIDGYNVLITVESILTGKSVIKCDDGYVRDLRAVFGKYRMSKTTSRALDVILEIVTKARPKEVTILFDQQVSRSGELAAMARQALKRFRLVGNARTVVGADFKIRGFGVVASSDRAIIERAKAIWDIPAEVLKHRKVKLIDLTKF